MYVRACVCTCVRVSVCVCVCVSVCARARGGWADLRVCSAVRCGVWPMHASLGFCSVLLSAHCLASPSTPLSCYQCFNLATPHRLFVKLVLDYLNEVAYPAQQVGRRGVDVQEGWCRMAQCAVLALADRRALTLCWRSRPIPLLNLPMLTCPQVSVNGELPLLPCPPVFLPRPLPPQAGLDYNLLNTQSGVQLLLSGYNHKLPHLMTEVLGRLGDFKVRGPGWWEEG